MVMALVKDLLGLSEHTVTLIRDARLTPCPINDENLKLIWIQPDEVPEAFLPRSLETVDAAWPIAPETGGCLADLCQIIEVQGKRLLTTSSQGVRLNTSKLETLQRLALKGVPIVPTRPLESLDPAPAWDYPWVFKIDDGVGCEDTIIIHGTSEWRGFQAKKDPRRWLAQPLVEGAALSLSGLFFQGEGRLLTCNQQIIRQNRDGFSLRGITVHAEPDSEGVFKALMSRVAQTFPALWGFAGIDLIFGPEGPKVLEINPRLTSAYPGIRPATGMNPAALVLELAQNHALPFWPEPLPGKPVNLDWSLH